MKRTKVLAEIKRRGWHGDLQGASQLQIKHGIGAAAARKSFSDGKKSREWGEPCGCAECAKKGAI